MPNPKPKPNVPEEVDFFTPNETLAQSLEEGVVVICRLKDDKADLADELGRILHSVHKETELPEIIVDETMFNLDDFLTSDPSDQVFENKLNDFLKIVDNAASRTDGRYTVFYFKVDAVHMSAHEEEFVVNANELMKAIKLRIDPYDVGVVLEISDTTLDGHALNIARRIDAAVPQEAFRPHSSVDMTGPSGEQLLNSTAKTNLEAFTIGLEP